MLFAWTAFCSSLLLFLVQPMIAKAILPWFGGSAGVWTTAVIFFQVFLLIGYAYAYWTTRHLKPMSQMVVHWALLVASLFALPISLSHRWKLEGSVAPSVQVLAILISSVGLPYFLLSSTGPLIQVWRSRIAGTPLAYRLFAVSNAASLMALLAYPVVIEPLVTTRSQMKVWSIAYAAFVALTVAAAWMGRCPAPNSGASDGSETNTNAPGPASNALCVTLAACPSILWLAVSNTLSQHVAPIPFLWVLPLSIYLLTLIVCFHQIRFYGPATYRFLLPVGWVLFNIASTSQGALGLWWTISLFAFGLLFCCMFCHGELARRKPELEEHVTSFYMMVALGGAIGGVFVGAAAPALFHELLELPIGVGMCIVLATRLLYGFPLKRIVRLGVIGAVGLAAVARIGGVVRGSHLKERNFYGVLEVKDIGNGDGVVRVLDNGPIRHGVQFMSPAKRRLATGYYGTDSGVGVVLNRFQSKATRVGIIGLGAGTLATYARPGDSYRFYEINPAVIRVANKEFSFLSDCQSDVSVVPGDARLALEHEPRQGFDVLVVDAFNGDSVPVHLLTQEAFALYFSHLRSDGVLAVHVSNRYLDLAPVVGRLAESYRREARLYRSPKDVERQIEEADWVLVSSNLKVLRQVSSKATAILQPGNTLPWTDNYSNVFQVLR
jgi:hypothetical protein